MPYARETKNSKSNKNLYLDNKTDPKTGVKIYKNLYKKKNNVYKKGNPIKTKREKTFLKYLNAIYI